MSIRLFPGVLLTLAASGLMPLSAAHAANTCEWSGGAGTTIRYVADLGTLYVPRDAQIGDPIGPVDKAFLLSAGGPSIDCETDGSVTLTFDASAAVPPARRSIARRNGMQAGGTVLQTNISGVGAQITFGRPYDGSSPDLWKLRGFDSSVPFQGYIDFPTPFVLPHAVLRGTVTLVKTGPISQGMQPLDQGRQMVSASFTNVPNAFSLALKGSVTQAECTLSTNPVSADPVPLGDWSDSAFTGEGHTTNAVPFTITLNSCISDPLPGGTVTNAHIRLDPTAGSTTLDAGLGLFSLGSSSTAQGIGIQVLARDALTPVALETDVLQGAIPATGGMLLEFNARYYQTGPISNIVAGSADGALGFTITYK
jgi:type 1 fimbria pilin